MALVDNLFIKNCKNILYNGEEISVRPHWPDGTQAKVFHVTNVVNEYDVGREFPLMTLRKTGLKSAVDEVLWIYQKASNNIKDLHSHIWDQWADKDGTIGKAYGYQIGQTYVHHKIDVSNPRIARKPNKLYVEFENDTDSYPSYCYNVVDVDDQGNISSAVACLNQMDAVLWDLRNDPHSRRIMTSTYNFRDLHEMALYPCCYSCTYMVFKDTLNMILNQRSADMLAAGAWNIAQYAALLIMVATATGFKPGKLTHVIGDAHIYDRHVPIVKELIQREDYDAPIVKFEPDNAHDFYSYKPEDFKIENYTFNTRPVPKFEVAI